jgi:hypothetical protein
VVTFTKVYSAGSAKPRLRLARKKPSLRPWLIYSLPFLTIYWDPIKQIVLGDNEFNVNVADIAILVIILSSLFDKKKPEAQQGLLGKYGAISPAKLFLLTWLMAVPMIITTTILFSPSMGLSDIIIFAKRIGEYAIIAILIPRFLSFRDIKPIFAMIMISGGVVSAVAISEAANLEIRVASWLMYANNLGIYAVVVFNVAVAVLMSPLSNRKERLAGLISAALSFGTLVLSGSRAASLGLLASMIYWLLMKWPRTYRRKPTIWIIIVFVIAVIILVSVGGNFLTRWEDVRTEGIETPQVQARIQASKLGLRLFLHYPFLGTGISGLPQLSLAYFEGPRYWLIEDGLHNAGNQFLQIAVEGGLAAFIIFIFWLIKIKNLIFGRFTELDNENRLLLPKYAVRANMFALLVAGTGMHTFYVPQVMAVVWILVGMLYVNKTR